MDNKKASRSERPADLRGEIERPVRPVQAEGSHGELKVEGVVFERLAERLAVNDQRRGCRRVRGDSDCVEDADLSQGEHVLTGEGFDAESSRIGEEKAFGDQILEDGGVVVHRFTPFLGGEQKVFGDKRGGGTSSPETEVARDAGAAFDGDHVSESDGQD